MRRINRRVHVLKQWLPSWTYLMYAKEIRWLLRSIYIQSHTPFAVDPHKNLWSVLGTGRSAIFMRIQFTSDPLRVNILSRNIKRNLLYQTSNLILCLWCNWTEWSAIWAEIISMISDQNCTTRGSITTLLHPFWNRLNTGLGQFKYFIDAVLSRFEIKFIHF